MSSYQGIKILSKVIIVEKTFNEGSPYKWKKQTVNQGYVVDFGNDKMLETAKNWAAWTWYDRPLSDRVYEIRRNHCKWDYTLRKDVWDDEEAHALYEKLNKEYYDTQKKMEGIIHEYDNGTFELILDEAAGSSSQGGKLSFWNCLIKAPDGKMFLIGIGSDILLHLMMSNTFVNGACQSKVWLGRIKGKTVGAFTENMEEFAQSIEDEKIRQKAKEGTTKYVPGDIVGNYGYDSKWVYLGTVYSYFKQVGRYGNNQYMFYDKPKLMHLYYSLRKDGTFDESYYPNGVTTKTKYNDITGHIDLPKSAYEYLKNKIDNHIAAEEYEIYKIEAQLDDISYSDRRDIPHEEILERVKKVCNSTSRDYTFYTEEEWNR